MRPLPSGKLQQQFHSCLGLGGNYLVRLKDLSLLFKSTYVDVETAWGWTKQSPHRLCSICTNRFFAIGGSSFGGVCSVYTGYEWAHGDDHIAESVHMFSTAATGGAQRSGCYLGHMAHCDRVKVCRAVAGAGNPPGAFFVCRACLCDLPVACALHNNTCTFASAFRNKRLQVRHLCCHRRLRAGGSPCAPCERKLQGLRREKTLPCPNHVCWGHGLAVGRDGVPRVLG